MIRAKQSRDFFWLAIVWCGLNTAAKAEYYCGGSVSSVALYGDAVHVTLSSPPSDTVSNYGHTAGTVLSWVAVCRLDGTAVPPATAVIHSASACKSVHQSLVAAKLSGAKVRFAFTGAAPVSSPCSAPTKPNWSSLPGFGMYFGPELFD